MAEIIVQQWGNDFAIRVPRDVAMDAGLFVGERIDVSMIQGDLLLRRLRQDVPSEASRVAEEMIEESKHYTLGISIRTLLDEGRRS